MGWFFTQLLVQLILAVLLGVLVGWLLWGWTLRQRSAEHARELGEVRARAAADRDALAVAHREAAEARAAVSEPSSGADGDAGSDPHEGDAAAAAMAELRAELSSVREAQSAAAAERDTLVSGHSKAVAGLQEQVREAEEALGRSRSELDDVQRRSASAAQGLADREAEVASLQARAAELETALESARSAATTEVTGVADAAETPAAESPSSAPEPTVAEAAVAPKRAKSDSARGGVPAGVQGLAGVAATSVGEPQAAAPAVSSAPATPDDLQVIEGIGPRVAGALRAAGVDSFAKLQSASEEELRNALQSAKLTLAPSLPWWGRQAGYLVRGDHEGLLAYQDVLVGGVDPGGDDLERIEGIGPRISGVLRDAGVVRYAQLAASEEEGLREILRSGGLRSAPSVGTWARQAALLAKGDEEGFLALLEQLVGGRDIGSDG